MKLEALSLADLEQVRLWRNEQPAMLRTPFLLTAKHQEQFYRDVVCNRQANARYWGIFLTTGNGYTPINYTQQQIDDYHKGNAVVFQVVPDTREVFFGMCGLENIQWENRLAEISMTFGPGCAVSEQEEAVRLLLREGFMSLNLENIFAEVYECSPDIDFWCDIEKKYSRRYAEEPIILPNRKYWDGRYWGGYYINFNRQAFVDKVVKER